MFYAQFILAKKGPLSKIWLAAHWEKKLTKAQIFETDVSQAIEEVITPKVKMALRTVGHLLLGIVRIYSKKTRYLLADTNEAFLKMRLNFRNGIQLEIENLLGEEENNENIDVYDEINMTIPEFMDVDLDEGALQANLSRFEDITLKDDYDLNAPINLKGVEYPKFGASGKCGDFGDLDDFYGSWPASSIHTPVPESFEHVRRSNDSQLFMEPGVESNTIIEAGSEIKAINETNIGKDFEFDNNSILAGMEGVRNAISANGDDLFSSIIDIIPQETIAPGAEFEGNENMELGDETGVAQPENYDKNDNRGSFSLEPLNTTLLEGRSKKKAKRPRKLIVDDSTCVSADILKNQVEDFSDILATITMAPPSKKMLKMCMTGDLNHLMSEPGMSIGNKQLVRLYQSHLIPTAYKADIGFEQPEESSSSDRQSQPWDELELNDQIADDVSIELGVDRVDSRIDDFIDIDHPIDDPQIDRTMELIGRNDLSEIAPMSGEGFENFGFNNGENKENDEVEEYNDPFSMTSNSSRGKLEAYGFGSAVKKAIYDDSKWAKRTKQILKKIGSSMENEREISFSTIVSTAKNRKQAAEQFYSLLSLAKSQAVTVEQKEPFGEILIRSGEKFREHLDEAEKSDMADLSRVPLQII